MGIVAIILSAGYSSRMGEFKPLLTFGDATVLERDIFLFRDAGIDDVRVVIGHRADDLLPLVERMKACPVINERFSEGMYSSVKAGVASLGDDIEAFFLLPVDIPLVSRRTISLLVESFHKGCGNIIYPSFYGKRGHPPLISTRYRNDILAWNGEGGLKSFLSRRDDEAVHVETEDESILLDMDTLVEYDRLRSAWRKKEIPAADECEKLMKKTFGADMPLMEHCRKVSKLAVFLAKKLKESGLRLDPDLIEAASLLHDLAKGRPNHAAEGARILDQMGYHEIARIVGAHMDITIADEKPVEAAEILYLADKMTSRNRYVTLRERFQARLVSSSSSPEILLAVKTRLENARKIQTRLERHLKRPLDEILEENGFLPRLGS
jgi:CTP:molybdopterin cytidylyltransferase MocA/HD superfamily phosphohydrolase YqeK